MSVSSRSVAGFPVEHRAGEGSQSTDPAVVVDFHQRQSEGTLGKDLNVIANAYDVVLKPCRRDLAFFDVQIQLEGADRDYKVRKDENRLIIKYDIIPQLEERYQVRPIRFGYDDEKTLLLVNWKPPGMSLKEQMDLTSVESILKPDGQRIARTYRVRLTFTKELRIDAGDLGPEQSLDKEDVRKTITQLQALNLILRESLQSANDTERNQNGTEKRTVVSLNDKVFSNIKQTYFRNEESDNYRAIWPGFTAAFRIVRCGLILNADLTHSVFFKDGHLHKLAFSALEVPNHMKNGNFQMNRPDRDSRNLTDIFRGRLVEFMTSDGRTHSDGVIRSVKARTPADQFYNMPVNGQATGGPTVQQVYSERNHRINFPGLPVVEVLLCGERFMVPMEYCYLQPGQRYIKPLSKQEQAQFIRIVSGPPNERISTIAQFMEVTNVRNHPLMRELGIVIAPQYISIRGRQLNLPEIEYGGNARVLSKDGSWNIGQQRYVTPGAVKTSVVAIMPGRSGNSCMDPREVRGFFQQLQRDACSRGMEFGQLSQVLEFEQDERVRFAQQFEEALQRFNPDMVFAIFEKGMDSQYADFKRAMDNVHGVPSQGLLCDTIKRNPRGCIDNILFKVNVKNGGTNCVLSDKCMDRLALLNRYFMVMGISLSHGKTKSSDAKPSYAAFVGSMDDSFKKWRTEVKVTGSHEAVLTDITDKIKELMNLYKETNKQYPEVLIVYRDGVTRTHEAELQKNDLKCLRRAFDELQAKTALIFIVVNKMHRTRFFLHPENNRMGEGQYVRENIPAGTVVDKEVVDPYGDDFYMASHRGALGTSRPIRYNILENDLQTGDVLQVNADDVQALTLGLCYVYQRCTMGVAIPAPLYYANLAAARCSVLADSVMRERGFGARGRGGMRGGARGGRGGRGRGGGRGGFAGAGAEPIPLEVQNAIKEGVKMHRRHREQKRLNYI